jgi:LysM repeat protein
MYGRRARPPQSGKLAEQAARITPALAVAGAMLGMPFHVKPPPPSSTPVERVELDSSVKPVKPASPAKVYVVQAGDSLWTIARQFYGNPLMWSHIYYANQSHIRDPNLIYQGQKLTIPPAGTTSARTSSSAASTTNSKAGTSSSSATHVRASHARASHARASRVRASRVRASRVRASSPSSTTGYIQQAAQGTGLAESVVAAQVRVESNYDSGAVSPAGAEGPYQFMPSTWATLGFPAGQEFNWATSTHAYISFMRLLLAWSGGNVRQALAAYNAGQGNWQAGLGYADQILSMAGHG